MRRINIHGEMVANRFL